MFREVAIQQLREDVALCYRTLHHFGIIQNVSLALGHVSARIPGTDKMVSTSNRIWPRSDDDMTTGADMVINDFDGNVIEAPTNALRTPGISDIRGVGVQLTLHTDIYNARSDVGGVVRAHPFYAGVLTVLNKTIVPMMSAGCELFQKPILVNTNPENDRNFSESSKDIAQLLLKGGGYAVLHKGHGAVVVGETVQQATVNMMILEEQAKANYIAYLIAGFDHPHLSDEYIRKIAPPDQRALSDRIKAMYPTPFTVTVGRGLWAAIKAELSK